MIELTNLTKIFNLSGDEKDRRIALDHVNLTINDGEFVTIIGSNGSGKTTLMKTILRLLKPISGEIKTGDGVLCDEIGYLPQQTDVQRQWLGDSYNSGRTSGNRR